MKVRYKAALIMVSYGFILVSILTLGYNVLSRYIIVNHELTMLKSISNEIAHHLDSHLEEKARIAITISTAPIIKKSLLNSHSNFLKLTHTNRKRKLRN